MTKLSAVMALLALGGGLVALGAPRRARADDCQVAGQVAHMNGLRVSPRGGPSFAVAVDSAQIRATLPRAANGNLAVSVRGTIAFEAAASAAVVPFAVAQPGDYANGMLHVVDPASFQLAEIRSARSGVSADIVTTDGTLDAIALTCGELTLADAREASRLSSDDLSQIDLAHERATYSFSTRRIELRAQPGAGATLRIETESIGFAVSLEEERGRFVRVKHTFGDGSTLEGWTTAESIREDLGGIGTMGTDLRGSGVGAGCTSEPGVEADVRVRPGTPVYSTADGGGAWATVETSALLTVKLVDGARFVEVSRLPGVSFGEVEDGEFVQGCETRAYLDAAAIEIVERRAPRQRRNGMPGEVRERDPLRH